MRAVRQFHPDTDLDTLIAAAKRQDDGAVLALIERCQGRIAAAIEISGVPRYDPHFDDAQNLALFEIWKQFPQITKSDSVCFWMHGIARRVTASRVVYPLVRQRRRDERYRNHQPARVLEQSGVGNSVSDRDLLGRVLNQLTVEHREVLVLRYLEGFSEQETAALLQIPIKTVTSRTSRAKRAAMDLVNEMEDTQ